MGTPEKKQMIEDCVGASAAAEGSPVFNYISNLSPIKPVKSTHISHTFQELNCASPPYAFSFPRISCTGQSSNLRRDRLSASSDAKFSPNNEESKTPKRADVLEHPSCSIEAAVKLKSDGVHSAASQEDSDQGFVLCSSDGRPIYDDCSTTQEATIPSIRESNLVIEGYQILHYIDNVSKGVMTPPDNVKAASGNEMASIMPSTEIEPPGISSSFAQFVNISNAYKSQSEQGASEIQIHTANVKDSVGLLNQENGEGRGCDWGDIVNDIDEFFLFSPSAEAEVQSGQAHLPSNLNCSYGTSFAPNHSQTITTGWNKIKICGSLQSSHNVNRKDSINGSKEPEEQDAIDLTPQMSSTALQSVVSNGDRIEKTDDRSIYPDGHWIPLGCKVEQQQVRGVKRRCLVFEAVGHNKNMEGNAELIDSKPSHSERNLFPDDKQLVPSDATYNSRRVPSGIGLHLNSLANPSMVGRVIKQDAMISGSQVMNTTSLASVNPASVAQEPTESCVDLKLADGDFDISEEKISPVTVVPAFEFGEEIIQQSPKKKRRKASQSGEKEGCKKCHCKRSKCLKLYCECFAAGVYCIQQCSCQGCLNKPEHEDTVLETRERIESRNPLAFVPKVVKPAEPVVEIKEEENKLSVSARHKTGCNCKKSKCLKKYCECFQGGVGCSNGCRCEGCMNTFGKKEDCSPCQFFEGFSKTPKLLTGSREVEEEVSEVAEPYENLKCQEIEKDDDKQTSQGSSLTAFEICRSAILPPPFLSSGKAPQSSHISGCNTANTGFLLSRLKSEKHFMRTILEDDTPEFLRVCQSPNDKVMVASPKRKRISPPRIESGAYPGFRNSRKLVLHPISSLQPLRAAHCSEDLSSKSS